MNHVNKDQLKKLRETFWIGRRVVIEAKAIRVSSPCGTNKFVISYEPLKLPELKRLFVTGVVYRLTGMLVHPPFMFDESIMNPNSRLVDVKRIYLIELSPKLISNTRILALPESITSQSWWIGAAPKAPKLA